MTTRRFTITDQHLKLLQRMWVDWDDSNYHGAPAIDLKRPYGNSSVIADVAEIVGVPNKRSFEFDGVTYEMEDEIDYIDLPEALEAKLRKLHEETAIALQICLRTQTFETGTYECGTYGSDWHKVEEVM